MLSLTKRLFTFGTGKYFKDTSFKNVTAIAYDTPGNLSRLCNVFASYGVNLTYLRTHCENLQKGGPAKYRVELSLLAEDRYNYRKVKEQLESMGIELTQNDPIVVPWFPRKRSDMDKIGFQLLEVGESKDHSQFQDTEYVQRRNLIAKIALEYRMKDKIPDVPYKPAQHELWRNIYKKLSVLHNQAMCEHYLENKSKLEKQLNIGERIPQLSQLSEYLKARTGFTIKPTHGILSQREFLNSFAFKIFCSTQYLRNVKNPDYTPEPDIVHEIVGHVPMFADPEVAKLSHIIGLLSLGASDEQISKLGSLYWFTLEFGVCKEKGKIKGYGAGIASSIGEIEHFLGRGQNKPQFQKLNIFKDCTATYPVQTVQPVFKVTQTFDESLKDLERYGRQIMKPITTVFNEEDETIIYDRNIEGVYIEPSSNKF